MRDRTTSVKGTDEPGLPEGLDNVLFNVWLLLRSTFGLLDGALRPVGLDADEFGLYSLLRAEPRTPSELARFMAAPPTTVSSSVKRLEGRGHIERVPNPDDGRSYRVRLTAEGERVHTEAGVRFLPLLDAVVTALGTDEPKVRRAVQSLREAIDAASHRP